MECEVFGVVAYDPEMTYYEVNEAELALIAGVQEMLKTIDAEHLDFWGTGDGLQFQFTLSEFNAALLRETATGLSAILPDGLAGRLVGLDKQLTRIIALELGNDGARDLAFFRLAGSEAERGSRTS